MRDENGFKCHTQTEAHVRQMLIVGADSRKAISDFSSQFQRDFLTLLRTSHGEKKIDANRFYQEYISHKEHVHMNSTRWVTLGEFVKMLGREGICRVEDGERGLMIAWIDNSPEALKRQEAVRKKERMDRGDELREQKLIREQVERAQVEAEEAGRAGEEGPKELVREEGEKVKLAFAPAKKEEVKKDEGGAEKSASPDAGREAVEEKTDVPPAEPPKFAMKIEAPKKKNVFASMGKKDKKDKEKKPVVEQRKRPMSEAERIMKMEQEQNSNGRGIGFNKRQRL